MSHKRQVLIVEDEFVLYEELTSYFEKKGFAIIGNPSGKALDNYDDAVKLLKETAADIAILDIDIKGKKDGLELAAYIKQHYDTLIVILTGNNNHENLERAKLSAADGFVLKIGKPVNLEQLWVTISMALPKLEKRQIRKTQGMFFKVKEIDTQGLQQKFISEYEPLDLETFIRWHDIKYINSYNSKQAGEGNNNILMHRTDSTRGYVYRCTLSEIYTQLPDFFARFDQSNIVNLHHITARGRSSSLYFIGEEPFKISDTYKEAALEKIKMILGDKF